MNKQYILILVTLLSLAGCANKCKKSCPPVKSYNTTGLMQETYSNEILEINDNEIMNDINEDLDFSTEQDNTEYNFDENDEFTELN